MTRSLLLNIIRKEKALLKFLEENRGGNNNSGKCRVPSTRLKTQVTPINKTAQKYGIKFGNPDPLCIEKRASRQIPENTEDFGQIEQNQPVVKHCLY